MARFIGWAVLGLACLQPAGAWAVTFRTLYSFGGGSDGSSPQGRPLIGQNGVLYGTTASGGTGGGGTVFQLDPATGIKTTLYNFTLFGATGSTPAAGVIADAKGNLYGTTQAGGSTAHCNSGCGVVFHLVPATQALTVLYTFSGQADGAEPSGRLVFDAHGQLYGTTRDGGDFTDCNIGCGTVFALKAATKSLTTLHQFGAGNDGAFPAAGLVFDSAGLLYGTASVGGAHGSGVVFKLDPASSAYTVLHAFNYHVDGSGPAGDLAFKGASLFGTTPVGGPTTASDGTLFQIDPTLGTVTTLHSFQGPPGDGASPTPGITPDQTLLVGTTDQGGSAGLGTIYIYTPSSHAYAVVYGFANKTDGASPAGGLAASKTGTLYGVTSYGNGTVFSIGP